MHETEGEEWRLIRAILRGRETAWFAVSWRAELISVLPCLDRVVMRICAFAVQLRHQTAKIRTSVHSSEHTQGASAWSHRDALAFQSLTDARCCSDSLLQV